MSDMRQEPELLSNVSADKEKEGVHEADRDCRVIPMADAGLLLEVVAGSVEVLPVEKDAEDTVCTEVARPAEEWDCENRAEGSVEEKLEWPNSEL